MTQMLRCNTFISPDATVLRSEQLNADRSPWHALIVVHRLGASSTHSSAVTAAERFVTLALTTMPAKVRHTEGVRCKFPYRFQPINPAAICAPTRRSHAGRPCSAWTMTPSNVRPAGSRFASVADKH